MSKLLSQFTVGDTINCGRPSLPPAGMSAWLPATESEMARLAFIAAVWQAIDGALASLCEIQNDVRERRFARPRA
jgi:hypothetical protein